MNMQLKTIIAFSLIYGSVIKTGSIRHYLTKEAYKVKANLELAKKDHEPIIHWILSDIALTGICNCMADDKESDNEVDSFRSCFEQATSIKGLMPKEDQEIYAKILEIIEVKALENSTAQNDSDNHND